MKIKSNQVFGVGNLDVEEVKVLGLRFKVNERLMYEWTQVVNHKSQNHKSGFGNQELVVGRFNV